MMAGATGQTPRVSLPFTFQSVGQALAPLLFNGTALSPPRNSPLVLPTRLLDQHWYIYSKHTVVCWTESWPY